MVEVVGEQVRQGGVHGVQEVEVGERECEGEQVRQVVGLVH